MLLHFFFDIASRVVNGQLHLIFHRLQRHGDGAARLGIFAGVVLAIGRIVGETAALVFTSGTVAGVPKSIMGSGRTLSIHMYVLMSEGLHMNEAKGVAVVLLILVLALNFLSARLQKGLKNG